ncbi:MAG: mechanosensitive ion channel family protein, partial [Chlorobi bacterium]|nr:mechanosensitive ion channel family protein [Chlorobiota bacterium]
MKDLIVSFGLSDDQLLIALLVFLGYLIVALIINFLIAKVFKPLARIVLKHYADSFSDIIKSPVFFTIILKGIISFIRVSHAIDDYVVTTENMIYSLIAMIWTALFIKLSKLVIIKSLDNLSDSSHFSKQMQPLMLNLSKVVIISIFLTVLAFIWDVDVTAIWASAGIVSVAVALAAKDSLSNFFGGITVIMDKPYKLGDYIELDKEDRGEVVEIGMRSTRIKTRDDILISIPNAIIANSKIVNESAPVPKFRIRVKLKVAYGTDIDTVEDILVNIARDNANVVYAPDPRVRFREYDDSGMNFELLCWAKEPALRGLTIHQINSKIYKQFNKHGIKFPFPQLDAHIYNHDSKNN